MPKNIFQIYKNLPAEIKNKMSEEQRMTDLEEIEKKYNLNLAEYVIRVLINDINLEELSEVLVKEQKIKIESANNISQDLQVKIYGDVYEELKELGLIKVYNKENVISDLESKYGQFANSSLFQNILAGEEMMKNRLVGAGGQINEEVWKNEFYSAINAGDQIKVVAAMRLVAAAGKLRQFFSNDQRYLDFFGGFLERHRGNKAREEFLQEPAAKKHLSDFIQFVLEKRLNFSHEQSAMIGAGISALAQEAGEKEYESLAYGDETVGRFVWE